MKFGFQYLVVIAFYSSYRTGSRPQIVTIVRATTKHRGRRRVDVGGSPDNGGVVGCGGGRNRWRIPISVTHHCYFESRTLFELSLQLLFLAQWLQSGHVSLCNNCKSLLSKKRTQDVSFTSQAARRIGNTGVKPLALAGPLEKEMLEFSAGSEEEKRNVSGERQEKVPFQTKK